MRNWFTKSFFRFALGFLVLLTVSFMLLIILSSYIAPESTSGLAAQVWHALVGD